MTSHSVAAALQQALCSPAGRRIDSKWPPCSTCRQRPWCLAAASSLSQKPACLQGSAWRSSTTLCRTCRPPPHWTLASHQIRMTTPCGACLKCLCCTAGGRHLTAQQVHLLASCHGWKLWGSSSCSLQTMAMPLASWAPSGGSQTQQMSAAHGTLASACTYSVLWPTSLLLCKKPAPLPGDVFSISSTLCAAGLSVAAGQERQALGGAAQQLGSSSHAAEGLEGPDALQHGATPCAAARQLDRSLATPALRKELLHTAAVAEHTVISKSEAAEQLMAALPRSRSAVAAGRAEYQPTQQALSCRNRTATGALPGRLQRHRAGSDALSEAARGSKAAAARQTAGQRHEQQQDPGTSGPAASDAALSSVSAPERSPISQTSRSFVGVLRGLAGSWGRHSGSHGPADDGGGTAKDSRSLSVPAGEPRAFAPLMQSMSCSLLWSE